jgi:hypothetical protein
MRAPFNTDICSFNFVVYEACDLDVDILHHGLQGQGCSDQLKFVLKHLARNFRDYM